MQRACIGVDVGGSKIHVGVVDRKGHVLAARRAPTPVPHGVSAVIEAIGGLAERCLADAGVQAAAVGVGIAGQIDTRAGTVRSSPNLPEWNDVPLARRLGDRLRLPVIVTNDLRAIARGEWRYGAGRGVADLVVLFLGTGVGGTVIAGGRLLVGAGGYAGELGHMPIVANGRKCHCPGRGCLEAYASGWALAATSAELLALHPEHAPAFAATHGAVTARELARAFGNGDALAKTIVVDAGEHLGAALVSITNVFNPARIIVGGGVIEGLPELLEIAQETLRRDAIGVSSSDVEIVRSSLGSEAGVLGAATLACEELQELTALR